MYLRLVVHMALSRLVYETYTGVLFWPQGHFGGTCGRTLTVGSTSNMELPVRFYNNHGPKTYRFRARGTGQTDRRTDRSIA